MHTLRAIVFITLTSALAVPKLASATPVPVAPLPSGTVIDSATTPFNYSGSVDIIAPHGTPTPYSFAGSFGQQVIRQIDGTLAFAYQFHMASNTPANDGRLMFQVESVNLLGFQRSSTSQLFVAPGSMALTPQNWFPEDTLGGKISTDRLQNLSVNGDLSTGSFFVTTTATSYDQNGEGILSFVVPGGAQLTFPAFETTVPGGPVPEPMSLALLPLAISALAVRRRVR